MHIVRGRVVLMLLINVMCFIVSVSGGQKPQFWANYDICGRPYRPPFSDEGQIWCARADPRSTFTCQIPSECAQCVSFRWHKNTILVKFSHFGGSCTDALSPMRAKFGVLEQTHGTVSYTHLTLPTIYSV